MPGTCPRAPRYRSRASDAPAAIAPPDRPRAVCAATSLRARPTRARGEPDMISLDTRPTLSAATGTCRRTLEHAHAWADGELGDVERSAFEAHLADCVRCRRLAGAEARFIKAIRAGRAIERAPATLRDRVES